MSDSSVFDLDLIIFDMDGTLADRDTGELLPGVRTWFQHTRPSLRAKVCIASNQGGVGLRYWMERDGFGEPRKYPTAEIVDTRLREIMLACEYDNPKKQYNKDGTFRRCKFDGSGIDDALLSFAYQSKTSGKWGPEPDIIDIKTNHPDLLRAYMYSNYGEWSTKYRKPAPGMLLHFIDKYKAMPDRTLMVGDSEEDRLAAESAGCEFVYANLFFLGEVS